ncbi:MAG: 1-acyl-sn-glycerol-3-phosphate acyltransferase [Clostridia bacterium]|nr:1-acyl-sn-glycerol-3-phosphate acyltransferase [Clostridia bacterium]
MSLYTKLHKLLAGLVKRLYRVRVIGAENEPENAPFIVCANHISVQDVLILAACLKHPMRFLAKAELFRIPILSGIIRACGAIPIERGKGDVGALKKSISVLKEGEVLGLYPQGHRYPGRSPAETQPQGGVGLVVSRARCTVLPVCIQPKKFKVRPFRKTYVTIGTPISFDELNMTECNKSEYDRVAQQIFDSVCAMVKDDM